MFFFFFSRMRIRLEFDKSLQERETQRAFVCGRDHRVDRVEGPRRGRSLSH